MLYSFSIANIFNFFSYFVNSDDEIRNIERPNEYFKFFLTKNDRYNAVQKEAMNSK